jgi:SAM-dependent methyltransferase
MLAVARRLRAGIDWRQGDAEKLPFEDGAFDVVVSQFALMFLPDQVAALREMWRVLAPRGRLAVAVCAPMVRSKGYSLLAELLRREVGDPAAAMVEGYFAIGDEPALRRLCKAAGIAGASVLAREGWARFASIDELVRIEIKGSPLAGLVDEASYQRVLNAARQELRDFCDKQGKVSIRLDATIVTAAKR